MNILKDKECYGYLLIAEIKKRTKYDVSEGTIYPILNRMNEEGLIRHEWIEQATGIPRKYYKLTDKGISTLEKLNSYWDAMISTIQKEINQ